MKTIRPITQDDVNAAARGLEMLKCSCDELAQLIELHERDTHFAGQVITAAARQMLAAKLAMGARRDA